MSQCIVTSELDGVERCVRALELTPTATPHVWRYTSGTKNIPVHIQSDGIAGVTVTINGYAYRCTVLEANVNALLAILKASPAQQSRVVKISAPMPGLLKAVLTKDGATVKKGDTLFTLEAMKMENAIKTPVAGTVRNVTANEGVAFEKGALLCTIEPVA